MSDRFNAYPKDWDEFSLKAREAFIGAAALLEENHGLLSLIELENWDNGDVLFTAFTHPDNQYHRFSNLPLEQMGIHAHALSYESSDKLLVYRAGLINRAKLLFLRYDSKSMTGQQDQAMEYDFQDHKTLEVVDFSPVVIASQLEDEMATLKEINPH